MRGQVVLVVIELVHERFVGMLGGRGREDEQYGSLSAMSCDALKLALIGEFRSGGFGFVRTSDAFHI